MGCVSSTLLNQENEFETTTSLTHHIVSLTSSTYGFLSTLDHTEPSHTGPCTPTKTTTVAPKPLARFSLGSEPKSNRPNTTPMSQSPEVINSWELMAGLDSVSDSFRFSPVPFVKYDENTNPNYSNSYNQSQDDSVLDSFRFSPVPLIKYDENTNHNYSNSYNQCRDASFKTHSQGEKEENTISDSAKRIKYSLDEFEKLCPPKGENKAVIYTTSLRGVRTTFEACNAVRTAIQGLGIAICERDISMDRSFREELRELMRGKDSTQLVPPRVFIKGRYLGGAEEVMRIVEDGCLGELLEGLPKLRAGHVCEGCGDVRFLPCFSCNGSCKMVTVVQEDCKNQSQGRPVVVRCPDCNENGLVLCPICS